MSRNAKELPEPSSESLPKDSILPLIEAIQSELSIVCSIADLLASAPPSSTLKTATLPALGSFLLGRCDEILSSLDALHKAISLLPSAR